MLCGRRGSDWSRDWSRVLGTAGSCGAATAEGRRTALQQTASQRSAASTQQTGEAMPPQLSAFASADIRHGRTQLEGG